MELAERSRYDVLKMPPGTRQKIEGRWAGRESAAADVPESWPVQELKESGDIPIVWAEAGGGEGGTP